MKIYICDDNEKEREIVEKAIKNTILINNQDFSIGISTNNPYEVLSKLKGNNKERGIYFLDVELKEDINGVQLAAEIRKIDPNGFIIFITSHGELSHLTFTYKIEALDFIIKDEFQISNRVSECLIYIERKLRLEEGEISKVFVARVGDKNISIDFNNILFFETTEKLHRIKLHGVNRTLTFYGTMKEIIAKLDKRFYKCHRSYIVNKDYIKEVDTKNMIAILNNGQQVIISTRLLKGLL